MKVNKILMVFLIGIFLMTLASATWYNSTTQTSWLEFENNLTDRGVKAVAWTNSGCTYSNTTYKVGNWSLRCTTTLEVYTNTAQSTRAFASTSGSVTIWVRYDDLTPCWFFSNIDGSPYLAMINNGDNNVGLRIYPVDRNFAMPTGQWTFLAMTWNNGNASFYVNGTLMNKSVGGATGSWNGKFRFGSDYYNNQFNGNFDDFRYFEDRELNATEVAELYSPTSPPVDTAPQISIVYPLNQTYIFNVSSLNYTVTDDVGVSSCWYSLNDGATNTTVACGTNLTNLPSVGGTNTWTIWANDTSNNINSSSVTFSLTKLWFNPSYPFADNSFRVTSFINRSGANFTLAGQPYHLIGADSYYLADYATNHTYDDDGNEINGSREYVLELLNDAKYLNINVIRTWAGMSGGGTSTNWAISKTGGHYNLFEVNVPGNFSETMYQSLDWLISEASKRDIRLQLVLVNNWDEYGGMNWYNHQSPTINQTWQNVTDNSDSHWDVYHDQFFTDNNTLIYFKNYINNTLMRNNTITGILYKDDPAIFSWMIANEPRAKTNGYNRNLIVNWTKNITQYIKSIDTNHLVTLGIEGLGYNETWGEGTDMISDHNGTGVDYATFAMHPSRWNYFAERSETSVDNVYVCSTGSGNCDVTYPAFRAFWVSGYNYTYDSRYSSGVPLYIPKQTRHSYENWVTQNVKWANSLGLPVLLQETSITQSSTDAIKDEMYNYTIHNFYSNGGDGVMYWTLNHKDYYYSTQYSSYAGKMDDGFAFYVTDDATLKPRSASAIKSFDFAQTDNAGGSWITLLNNYKYDFGISVGTPDDTVLNNYTLHLNISYANGSSSGFYIDQINTSEITANSEYIFTKQFTSVSTGFDWYLEACGSDFCNSSASSYVQLTSSTPSIALDAPADGSLNGVNLIEFNYTVTSTLDTSWCEFYVDGSLDQTDTTVTNDITQTFTKSFSTSTNHTWYIRCSDIEDNIGTSDVRTFTIDATVPVITSYSPQGINYNTKDILVNFTADNYTDLWYNFDGSNITYTTPVIDTFAEGSNTIYFYANDSVGNLNVTSITFLVDSTPPTINVVYPTVVNYNSIITELNYTVSDLNIDSCWYSIDLGVTNTSVNCGTNVTGLTSAQGSNTWMVWANDTLNNIESSSVTFFVDTVYPLIDYGIGTEVDGVNLSQSNVYINVTWTEINFANLTFNVYNLSGLVSLYNSSLNTTYYNFTSLADGNYFYNVTICDIANNCNSTVTRTITINTLSPNITSIVPIPDTYLNHSNVNFSANFSSNVGLLNGTLSIYNSTNDLVNRTTWSFGGVLNSTISYVINLIDGVYTWIWNIFDITGNEATYGNVTERLCYQETANVSTACGGLDTGLYSSGGSWDSLHFGMDGLWDENHACTNLIPGASYFVNYTKPADSTSATMQVLVHNYIDIGQDNYTNVTIPQACFDYSVVSINFMGWYYGQTSWGNWSCYNGSKFIVILSRDESDGGNTNLYRNCFAEEAMIWNISNTITVDTTFSNINFVSPTPIDGFNQSSKNVTINTTWAETNFANITFNLNNSLQTFTTPTYLVNYSNLSDGTYRFNVTICDLANNCNTSESRDVLIDSTAPNVLFNYQLPSDITSFNAFVVGANISYNISDVNGLNLSTIKLYEKINSSLRADTICYNGTCSSAYAVWNYIENNSETFIWNLDDNGVYPATYNFAETYMKNTQKSTGTLTSANQYLSTEFLNVTNLTQYNFFEIMSNSTDVMRFYYCNDSYGFSNNPTTNANCLAVSTLPANSPYNHTHNVFDAHQVISLALNVTTGQIGTIKLTPTSYILLRGNNGAGNEVNYYYISNTSRTGAMKTTTNGGNSWTNQTYTVSSHIHQYSDADSIFYYACANDTLNNQNCSSERQEIYQLAGLPPNVFVSSPIEQVYKLNIDINYSALSPNNYNIVNYTINLLNSTYGFNKTLVTNTTNLGYIFDSTTSNDGMYIIQVMALDNLSQAGYGYSENFTIDNTPPNLTIDYPISGGFYQTPVLNLNVSLNENGGNCTVNSTFWVLNFENSTSFSFVNSTTAIDGVLNYNITCWDNAGNNNSILLNYTQDTQLPVVVMANNSYSTFDNTPSIFFNATDNLDMALSCALYLNGIGYGGAVVTSGVMDSITTNATVPDGNYSINVSCYDNVNNIGSNDTTFVYIDSTIPNIVITSPVNSSNFTTVDILVNYTVSDVNIDSCWVSFNSGTNTSIVCGNNISFTANQGWNNVRVYANDTLNNINSSVVSLFVDSISPELNIIYPLNANYSINVSRLNYTVFDVNIFACWYSLNNGTLNTSINCGTNATSLISNEGYNNWTVWANDTLGNLNRSEVRFFRDTIYPQVQFVIDTSINGSTLRSWIIYANVTATDINLLNITSFLYNSSGLIESSNTFTSPNRKAFSFGKDGTYYINSTACDTVNNCNVTETRTIYIDTSVSTPPPVGAAGWTSYTYANTSLNQTLSRIEVTNGTFYWNTLSKFRVVAYDILGEKIDLKVLNFVLEGDSTTIPIDRKVTIISPGTYDLSFIITNESIINPIFVITASDQNNVTLTANAYPILQKPSWFTQQAFTGEAFDNTMGWIKDNYIAILLSVLVIAICIALVIKNR